MKPYIYCTFATDLIILVDEAQAFVLNCRFRLNFGRSFVINNLPRIKFRSMNWKNLKSLFVVQDEEGTEEEKPVRKDPPRKERPTEGNPIIKSTPIHNPNPNITIETEAETGKVNEKFVTHLLKAIEAADQPGIDYLEFKNTLQSFAKMPMDDHLRFQSALTAVKTMGANEQTIISSAEHYLKVLKNEEEKFLKAAERNRANKVDGQITRVKQMKEQKQQKAEMIARLQKEIAQMDEEIKTATQRVKEDQTKIENSKNHFFASYEYVAKQIRRDLEKLKSL